MEHLWQLSNLHWHILITQSRSLTEDSRLSFVQSVDLDKCKKTSVHHYSIIQSSFIALKVLFALLIHLSLHSSPSDPQIFFNHLYSFTFSGRPYSWTHTVSVLSSVLLVTCIYSSSMFFHDLILHFFLALNIIPLSGCFIYSFIYWGASWSLPQFWQLWVKVL